VQIGRGPATVIGLDQDEVPSARIPAAPCKLAFFARKSAARSPISLVGLFYFGLNEIDAN
jgi:hypothetical protein